MRLYRRPSLALRGALLGGACLILLPATGHADSSFDDLEKMRRTLQQQIAKLKNQEDRLQQEFLLLDQKNAMLDRQLRRLRATGTGSGSGAAASAAAPAPAQGTEVAQASTSPATSSGAPGTAAPGAAPGAGESAPISGPSPREEQARRTLQTAPSLASTGGVLTPKGQIVVDPSFEYDYYSQNQLGVNGFQLIPGIIFGNINVLRVQQNVAMPALTLRGGVTDRFELNIKIPYVYAYQNATSAVLDQQTGTTTVLSPIAHGSSIGDVQLGASYQFNNGSDGWPIFVGNLLFKTITGTSPFDVPLYTINNAPNQNQLWGIQQKAPTGTGFYALEPSVTLLYPTAPGVLFANVLFIQNFARDVNVMNPSSGTSTRESVQPGQALSMTFGIGFSLNENTSMTLSYQQEHVFAASIAGASVKGSEYDFGLFNFGLGYQFSRQASVNFGVGIGAGPNAPVAKILVEVPYHFSL